MQRAAFQRALFPPVSTTLGGRIVYPVTPCHVHHQQLHSRTRPNQRYESSRALVRRSVSSSGLPATPLPTDSVTTTHNAANRSRNSDNNNDDDDPSLIYVGPLTRTFRRLKIFSLSSLALASALSPFIFIVESSLPFTARAALATAALGTSGVSTTLVAWCGRPYVTTLRRLTTTTTTTTTTASAASAASLSTTSGAPQEKQEQHTTAPTHSHNENAPAGIELTTLSLTLSPRTTRVYDPAFLGDTTRGFARWELAQRVQLPREDAASVRPGTEETVAETLNGAGDVLGRWIVTWGENGEGSCRAQGRVETHFNVHEELLTTPIR